MLQKTKITNRIALGFGVVVSLMLVLVVIAYWALQSVEQRMARAIQQDARIAEHSAIVLAKNLTLRRYEKDILLGFGNLDKVNKSFRDWSEALNQVEKSIAHLEEYLARTEENSVTERMRLELSKYQAGLSNIVERIRIQALKTPQEADQSMQEFKEGIQWLEKLVEDLGHAHNEKLQAATYQGASIAHQIRLQVKFVLLILVGIALAVGILLSGWIARSVSAPLGALFSRLHDITI